MLFDSPEAKQQMMHKTCANMTSGLLHIKVVDMSTNNCVCLQGLADTFIILGMPFDSPEAKQLNKDIFECIYYNALVTSSALAKVHGKKNYITQKGSCHNSYALPVPQGQPCTLCSQGANLMHV